jgi:8-oxo-dGTP pyrophosphatase MutT (NUDIX family)
MNSFQTVVDLIKSELNKPLPGLEVQLHMSPSSRNQGMLNLNHEEKCKNSSVLILLYPKNKITHIVFIKRANSGGPHSGQIGLPGGKFELVDKDLIDTALRETEEEVGVKHEDVFVLGQLTSLFIPVSNISVLPVVGSINYCPEFVKQISEVDEIIEVPLHEFVKESNKFIKTFTIREFEIIAPCYYAKEHVIWGATAMIMSEFVELVNRIGIAKN